jgi:ABC-2 type transport system ATP-binding protein
MHEHEPERSPLLSVDSLHKRFGGRTAVDTVSFSIVPGEVFGLLGPNGAGKTTTIRMVAGALEPTAGRVVLGGDDASIANPRSRRALGLVPQNIALYPALSALENLRFFARVYGVESVAASAKCEELLDLAGLTSRCDDRVASFSSGMKRRLSLACGLVHSPDVLLLDEPTVGVDPQSRERIYECIERLASAGLAVLLTTHYLDEAERLCHRIAVMDEGRFVAEGTLDELRARVGEERVARFQFSERPGPRLTLWLQNGGAQELGPKHFQLPAVQIESAIVELSRIAASEGNGLSEVWIHRPNLGDVFLALTGKALRD